jgi:hypothetical protein
MTNILVKYFIMGLRGGQWSEGFKPEPDIYNVYSS